MLATPALERVGPLAGVEQRLEVAPRGEHGIGHVEVGGARKCGRVVLVPSVTN